jgi:hemolysin III
MSDQSKKFRLKSDYKLDDMIIAAVDKRRQKSKSEFSSNDDRISKNTNNVKLSDSILTNLELGKTSRLKDESFGEEETFGEEVGNTITHGVMALIVLLMIPFATIRAYQTGGTNAIVDVIGVSVFMICVFLMFATSASYHSTKHRTTHKVIYNKLDHIAIFLAIAGTYTPIALSVIGGIQGVIMVIIQWSMVLTGVFIKIFLWRKSKVLSVPVYLIMGWSVVFFFNAFRLNATPELFWLVFAGGVFYSLGCIFYACKFKFAHMIFHFFINAGAALHFVGIVFFLSK